VIDMRAMPKKAIGPGHKQGHRPQFAMKDAAPEFAVMPQSHPAGEKASPPFDPPQIAETHGTIEQKGERGFDSLIGSMQILMQMETFRTAEAPPADANSAGLEARASRPASPARGVLASLPLQLDALPNLFEMPSAELDAGVAKDKLQIVNVDPPQQPPVARPILVDAASTELLPPLKRTPAAAIGSTAAPAGSPQGTMAAASNGAAEADNKTAAAAPEGPFDAAPSPQQANAAAAQLPSSPGERLAEITPPPARQVIDAIRHIIASPAEHAAGPRQTLRVLLVPEGLGSVEITISREKETLKVVLRAEKTEMKLSLAEGGAQLRDALSTIEGGGPAIECEFLDLPDGNGREDLGGHAQERAAGDLLHEQSRDRRPRHEWAHNAAGDPNRAPREAEDDRPDAAEPGQRAGSDRGAVYL
jgi:hypothetical protein